MNETKSVFLADDDDDDRLLIREAIQEVDPNVKVVEAKNGAELLDKMQGDDVPPESLIVVDMNMPVMNGLEAITAIRADPELAKVPAVMMSTSSSPVLEKKALEAGVNQFIVKPSSFRALIDIADGLVKRFFS